MRDWGQALEACTVGGSVQWGKGCSEGESNIARSHAGGCAVVGLSHNNLSHDMTDLRWGAFALSC